MGDRRHAIGNGNQCGTLSAGSRNNGSFPRDLDLGECLAFESQKGCFDKTYVETHKWTAAEKDHAEISRCRIEG